ncbi:MAG: hypothetical protein A3B37_03405 [Candidatus Sungbacteria bacterium RIFCSPLOWO2_01_FULL_59_16]|uniref:Phage holin family protein n=1 Tax=Candidatus Sungbacteria bacterium RIFCSPLOWO2_01_FULL_59_16 TaxID=1802280 RepID=A0A1G2LC69_9BACT|nr:MAG: hypothetical protein A3B37_03405 [Candidatus Sungbacteria bacterium RIFCSPLOWO2_01_FULL_59_16]
MRFLLKFLLRIAANAAALFVAVRYLPGFHLAPRAFPYLDAAGLPPFWQTVIIGGLVLALLNAFLKPLLKLVSFPLILVTFGFFHIVINLLILALADYFLAVLAIEGFAALLAGSILVGIANRLVK